jgi:hypothetical protein
LRILIEGNKNGTHELIPKEELQNIYCRAFSSNDGKIILEGLANVSKMYANQFCSEQQWLYQFSERPESFVLVHLHAVGK